MHIYTNRDNNNIGNYIWCNYIHLDVIHQTNQLYIWSISQYTKLITMYIVYYDVLIFIRVSITWHELIQNWKIAFWFIIWKMYCCRCFVFWVVLLMFCFVHNRFIYALGDTISRIGRWTCWKCIKMFNVYTRLDITNDR